MSQLGPYRIDKTLGRGGMGTVYKAVEEATGRIVAVKVLNAGLADDANFRIRFESEVETLKKLTHPNIVQLLAWGEQDGSLFYSMEYVEGRNLQDLLNSGERFDWAQTIRITLEVAAALKHAHDNGIVHRDLKPANLMRDSSNRIKLTDFGIAKLFGATHVTADGGVMGTADYMAPEQADGKAVTARTDLYSLGCVMYALLTRKPPFHGRSLPETIHAVKFIEPTSVRLLNPDVPPPLEAVIMQLLEKDPQKRPATAVVLSNRLKEVWTTIKESTSNASGPGDKTVVRSRPIDRTATRSTIAAEADAASETALHATGFSVNDPGATRDLSAPPTATAGAPTIQAPPVGATARTVPPTGDLELTLAPESGSTSDDFRVAPAPPPPTSRFKTVEEERLERERAAKQQEAEENFAKWLFVAALVVLLFFIGGIVWYFNRPLSADALYDRITARAQYADADALADLEPFTKDFLTRFPEDSRVGEIQAIDQTIELDRLERRLRIRMRNSSVGTTLSAEEAAYLMAMSAAETDPELAMRRLRAMIDVYRTGSASGEVGQKCIELAKRKLEGLENQMKSLAEAHSEAVEQQMRLADRLARSDETRVQAEAIWRGVIELYEHQPWAAKMVAEAKSRLGG